MDPRRAIVAVLAGGRGRRVGGAKASTPLPKLDTHVVLEWIA